MNGCKSHWSDYSSTIGVCASCLRENLVSLLHSPDLYPNLNSVPDSPPFVFPGPVSPCMSLFQPLYNTPQLGPTFTRRLKRQGSGKSGFVSKLLRSMRMTGNPDSGLDYSGSDPTTTSLSNYYCSYGEMSPDQGESPVRIRLSPWNWGGVEGFPGDIRVSEGGNGMRSSSQRRPRRFSDAASFWGSRTKQVADFGRVSERR